MILHFPNFDTLRVALSSGAVPQAVSLAPALAGFDGQGQIWVTPSEPLPSEALAQLRRLGGHVRKTAAVPLDQPVSCWPQLLPVTRDPAAGTLTDKTPVLFELSEEELPGLVTEILRLGNDRQSFRPLTTGDQTRVLLRVTGPPYYSVLRALDRDGRESAPRAYLERSPRVWVEISHTHALAEQIQPPAGQLLLLRPPREWTALDEAKFHDIYEIIDFALPAPARHWHDTDFTLRMSVTLRLGRGGSTEPAELWVLHQDGIDQLDALVRNSDDQVLSRLAFAVGVQDDRTTVVLRVRPSRQRPPELVLEGIGFRSYLHLPHLFLPCGTRLHPQLRRDVVSKLLAADPSQITWLDPNPDGTFTPETLPDAAFRPLEQWVDYVLDHDHEALQAWVEAAHFDFEPFICRDDQPDPARKAPEPKQVRPRRPAGPEVPMEEENPKTKSAAKAASKSRRRKPEEAVEPWLEAKPNELQQRRQILEKQFLDLPSPLDDPQRKELWREMAQVNGGLHLSNDATVCWVNSLWEPPAPPPSWLEAWFRAERKGADGRDFSGAELDHLLANPDPPLADVRALAAYLAWVAHGEQEVPELVERLSQVQHFLERFEPRLPIRAVWLAWVALVRLSRGDVLALARARDRLLERLYQQGLSSEFDLPSFMRFSELRARDRFRAVREQILDLRQVFHERLAQESQLAATTADYVDLTWAFGLARLGETEECHKLLQSAQESLADRDAVHAWLFQAYDYRIRQALEGKAGTGRLPADLLDNRPPLRSQQRYTVDKLCEHSRILEPHEKRHAYLNMTGDVPGDLSQELNGLYALNDHGELAARLTSLVQTPRTGDHVDQDEAQILRTALDLAPRLGESFARDLIDRVLPILDRLEDFCERLRLLEKALFLAAHFDQTAILQKFLVRFRQLTRSHGTDLVQAMENPSQVSQLQALENLLGHSFRSLRRLGLRDEIGHLLEGLAELILQGRQGKNANPKRFAIEEKEKRGKPGQIWSRTLRLLLNVAAGWFYFGRDSEALYILDQTRDLLLHGDLGAEFPRATQTLLACAYVQALGSAPIELALSRIKDLFRTVERIHDEWHSKSHYSLAKLQLVEAVVLSLVSDDCVLDKTGRRWLDDDEYLVRRRIHGDVRTALSQEG
jgi:hypothetical protein